MSSDPRVEFVVSGLSLSDAEALLGNLSVGAHGITVSTTPEDGSTRYAFDVSTGVLEASWALRSLERHLYKIADGDRRAEPPPGDPASLPANVGARLPYDERYVRLGPDVWMREPAEPHKQCWCRDIPRPGTEMGKEPVRNDVYPTVPSLD